MAVLPAAQSGDHRMALEALRDELAAAMDAADVNIKPQIAGQLRAVLADIRALPAAAPAATPKGVVTIDDAKRRRADRQSGAAPVPAASEGGGKRRR